MICLQYLISLAVSILARHLYQALIPVLFLQEFLMRGTNIWYISDDDEIRYVISVTDMPPVFF